MLRVIIEKEIRDLLNSTKVITTFGVCVLLILLAFYAGAANYKVSVSHYEAAKTKNLQQLEGITDWMMVERTRIFLPPQPLAALITGVSNDISRTTEVEPGGELSAHDSRYNEDPIFAVFRFLDLRFIFGIVLSLMAILLGYDAVSGEKEQGTLRLAMSNAVPRATYILGKLIGIYIALTVSLLIALGLGCLLLPIMGVPMTGGEWVRLALAIFAGLVYFGAFLAISVFVSSCTRRTADSFLILLVVWVVSVMIVPRAAVLIAGRAIDVPSVDELASKKATYATGLWKEFRDGMTSFEITDAENVEQTMSLFNKHMDSLTLQRESKMNSFAERLNEQRYNRQLVQQDVAFGLAALSPAASLSLATDELAGTSLSLKDRYHRDGMAYQQSFAAFMKEKTGINMGGGMRMILISDDEEEKEPIDPTEMPVFVYHPPSLASSVQASAVNIGILILYNLIFFAASVFTFNRYDAR